MTVSAVLRQKGNAAISVTPETPVLEIASIMAARRIGAVLIVTASGQVAGILSERDIVKAVADRRWKPRLKSWTRAISAICRSATQMGPCLAL
jgi:CBS domain-containing protein